MGMFFSTFSQSCDSLWHICILLINFLTFYLILPKNRLLGDSVGLHWACRSARLAGRISNIWMEESLPCSWFSYWSNKAIINLNLIYPTLLLTIYLITNYKPDWLSSTGFSFILCKRMALRPSALFFLKPGILTLLPEEPTVSPCWDLWL